MNECSYSCTFFQSDYHQPKRIVKNSSFLDEYNGLPMITQYADFYYSFDLKP